MEFTVDRKTWYRGKGGMFSKLLKEDGRKCCLGFLAKAYGYEDSDILNKASFRNLSDASLITRLLVGDSNNELLGENYCTSLHETIADINDNRTFSDETKEKELTELFAQADIKVNFIDSNNEDK